MGQAANRLTAVEVRNPNKAPGRYGDGGGLYLEILPGGQRQWLLRYQLNRRRRDMSLGAVTDKNGLAAARAAARDAHGLIAKGIDPIEERKRPAAAPAFAVAARTLIDDLKSGWRGRDTLMSWERSLLRHAVGLAKKPVDEITTNDLLPILRPMWSAMPESAAKLRERVERVLDAQRAAGAIRGAWENPARWKGHLALMLPKRQKLSRGHHPAMPYADTPAFLAAIRLQEGMGARALEFAILTATREGVVITARWGEIAGDVWALSAERMKMAKPLRVPLSAPALALLERVGGLGRKGFIFPGQRQRGRPAPHIGDATMDAVLKRMKLPYTPHGFRSTFRDWAGDCTAHPRDLIEEALAHAVGDETERAYRRSDALAKRRVLMDDWAAFLARPPVDKGSQRVGADKRAGAKLEGPQLPGVD